MNALVGKIERQGPFLDVTVTPTDQHVAQLRKFARPVPGPLVVRTLVDTGASVSVLDVHIVTGLGLIQTGSTAIHSPTTGPGYEYRDQYDVAFFFGSAPGSVRSFTVSVIGTELASEGFSAIIGWDILGHCVLNCDGPNRRFTLAYDQPPAK